MTTDFVVDALEQALYERRPQDHELTHKRGPWKTTASVELATLQWVHWFNHTRLLEPIGKIPPVEAEANYYRQIAEQSTVTTTT